MSLDEASGFRHILNGISSFRSENVIPVPPSNLSDTLEETARRFADCGITFKFNSDVCKMTSFFLYFTGQGTILLSICK